MRSRTALTLILVVIAVALGLLIYNHDSGYVLGLPSESFGQLVVVGLFASVLGSAILSSRVRYRDFVRTALIWLAILLGFVAVYVWRGDLQDGAWRMAAALVPGMAIDVNGDDGSRQTIVARSQSGHFETEGRVNGQPVRFLIDTGASLVTLRHEDAVSLGLNPSRLSFTLAIATANGIANAAPVRLDSIEIGAISRRNIRALVTEPGRLGQSLLGMNVIDTLSSFEIRRDEVILRD